MTRRIAHHIRVCPQLHAMTSYGSRHEPTCLAAVEPRKPDGRPRRSESRWQRLFQQCDQRAIQASWRRSERSQ